MTVIHYDNGSKVTIDTLVLDSLISSKNAIIDIYFCSERFQIPYYLPTESIYKDPVKDKECDMSKYPQNVKCYTYDEKNRVVKMSVNGSGTMGTWNYQYDSFDRIKDIEWLGIRYMIAYNQHGFVTELSVDEGIIKKRLEFIYE